MAARIFFSSSAVRPGAVNFFLNLVEEVLVAIGTFIDDVHQAHDVAHAFDMDAMAGVDRMNQSGFRGDFIDRKNVQPEEPVQGEPETSQQQDGSAEQIDEVLSAQLEEIGPITGWKLLPENDRQAQDYQQNKSN